MRILIAEDDSSLASFVKKGLDAEHYTVDVSSDGEQARAMAGEFDDDLVVLDLSLPRLDGVAILRYLRTCKPSMPIIIPTGRTRVEDRVELILSFGQTYRRSVARSRPFCPGRTTSVSSNRTMVLYSSNADIASAAVPAFNTR
jgi:CheY-like chemotaxis protein